MYRTLDTSPVGSNFRIGCVYLHGMSIAMSGSGLVDRTQHACHCTIPDSGLAWRTKYSCCFATPSARKQSSMPRVGGSVSDSSSFLIWSIFALMTCCCIANAPSSTKPDREKGTTATSVFALRRRGSAKMRERQSLNRASFCDRLPPQAATF